MPLAQTLEAVEEWYAERGLPGRIQSIVDSALDREVTALGYTETERPALRQVAPVGPALKALKSSTDASSVAKITTELPMNYFEAYRRGLGIPEFETILTTGDAQIAFGMVYGDSGEVLSVGRVAIDAGTGYAGIAAVATVEAARRRGLARIVLRDLLTFAEENGAGQTYLEVEPDNAPARALYASVGYTTAHRYHSRRRPSQDVAR